MNSLLIRNRERKFSRPPITKYVILMGVGVWMLTLAALIAKLGQEPDANWQHANNSPSTSESVALTK